MNILPPLVYQILFWGGLVFLSWALLNYYQVATSPVAIVAETKAGNDKDKRKIAQLLSALCRLVDKMGTSTSIDDNTYIKNKNNCIRLARQTNSTNTINRARHIIESFEYLQKAYLDAVFSGHTNNAETIAGNAKIILSRMLDSFSEVANE